MIDNIITRWLVHPSYSINAFSTIYLKDSRFMKDVRKRTTTKDCTLHPVLDKQPIRKRPSRLWWSTVFWTRLFFPKTARCMIMNIIISCSSKLRLSRWVFRYTTRFVDSMHNVVEAALYRINYIILWKCMTVHRKGRDAVKYKIFVCTVEMLVLLTNDPIVHSF